MEMKNINKKNNHFICKAHTNTGRDNHFSKIKKKHINTTKKNGFIT